MKKSIYLLLLLLIGCAPVTTVPLSLTVLPPTPTITLSPTLLPSPTTTPEGFQTSEGGAVQVFENGKWVNLAPPRGISENFVELTHVVLKDGVPYFQVDLNGYSSTDESSSADIAKYDTATKKWVGVDFSFTRTSGEGLNYATRNNDFIKQDIGPRIDSFFSRVTLLGLKYEKGGNLQIMVLYKNEVKVIKPNELVLYEYITPENHPTLILDTDNLDLNDMLQIIRFANESHGIGYSKFTPVMSYMVATSGTTEENCKEIGKYWYDSPTFKTWCTQEVSKGNNRKIFNKDNIDWELRNKLMSYLYQPILIFHNYKIIGTMR